MKLYRSNTHTHPVYRSQYEQWYNQLPTLQQAAVYDYTDYGYRSLNHALRYGKPLAQKDQEMLTHLDEALGQAVSPDEPRRLFRGVKALKSMPQVGEPLDFPAYLSTSSDPHQLFKFTDSAHPVVFELETHVGAPVSDIHEEYEFLLPRGTIFRVEEVLQNVDWHAEYEGTDYSRSLKCATVIKMTQDPNHENPRAEVP